MIKIKSFAASRDIILKNETRNLIVESSTLVGLLTLIKTWYPVVQQKISTQSEVFSFSVNVFVNGKKKFGRVMFISSYSNKEISWDCLP